MAFSVFAGFKLSDMVASTLPSFTVTITKRFIISKDIDFRNSGIDFDLTGVSIISSTG